MDLLIIQVAPVCGAVDGFVAVWLLASKQSIARGFFVIEAGRGVLETDGAGGIVTLVCLLE